MGSGRGLIYGVLLREFAWRGIKLLALCFMGAGLVFSGCMAGGSVLIVAMPPAGPAGEVATTTAPGFNTDPGPLPILGGGLVSDVERYALARAAGWSAADAITATAISFAEDGSGDPAALSGRNDNGTFDLGLWQINSSHWSAYGGQAALVVPINNARAAFGIFGPGRNWCAWSTYEKSCGRGYTGAYATFLNRARVAAAQGGGG